MSKTFTREEVALHNKEEDCYIIINSNVYDITKFIKFHPGGKFVLLERAGQDATKSFFDMHRAEVLKKYDRFRVGVISGEEKKAAVKYWTEPGQISQVPFSEDPAWLGLKSPYFNDTHFRLRKDVRTFMETEIKPHLALMEESGKEPSVELWKKMGDFGILASRIGPGKALELAPSLPSGLTPKTFDFFHEMIVHEEFSRLGCPGTLDGLGSGFVIGFPPLIHFGTPQLIEKYAKSILTGDKRVCLAISEAFAGSDVANIQTVATKSEDGKHYIVNGTKKWITNGTFCDYFVTAVRTGKKEDGNKAISLLFIERGEGLNTSKIHTSYSPSAGTAYVTYDNVKVPVENLLGEENKGFYCVMANFNHERWVIIVGIIASMRLIIEECFKWSVQRIVFGKPLIAQPVIREKLAYMVAQVESAYSWLENITHNMNKLSYKEQSIRLAGPIALLKMYSTRVAYDVSDKAVQIFGGRAITRGGMGQYIERFQRAIKYAAILGGSEEIMGDLGIRQALRSFPKNAKL